MSKADRRLAGAQRLQVAQAALMQGLLVVLLLGLALFYRDDLQTALLCVVFALVPAAWGFAIWDAQKRDAAARAAGTWSRAGDDALKRRTYGILATALVVAVGLAAMVYVLL